MTKRQNPNSNYYVPARPKQQKRPLGCLVRVLIAIFVIGAIYFWVTYKPSGRAIDLSPAIANFTGEPNMQIKQTGSEQTAYGSITQYSGKLSNGDTAYFDVDSKGNLKGFFRGNQPSSEVLISIEQARKTALDFASAHYPDSSWLQSVQINENLTGTNGSSNRFYTFMWVNQDPNSGAYLPQTLKIEINAQTGQVDSYLAVNEPVTISTVPAINQEKATEIAFKTLPSTPEFKVAEISLLVTTVPIYENNGQQALVWRITLVAEPDETGYITGATVFVNAQTGEVLLIDPFV